MYYKFKYINTQKKKPYVKLSFASSRFKPRLSIPIRSKYLKIAWLFNQKKSTLNMLFLFISICLLSSQHLSAFAQLGYSKLPILISSDNQTHQKKEKKSILQGNVIIRQGTDQLKAEQIIIYYSEVNDDPEKSDIKKIEASRNVTYTTPQEIIRGDKAFYDSRKKIIQFTGNAIIIQNKTNILKGHHLIYHLDTEILQIKSKNKNERVQAVFYPEQIEDR